VVNSTGIKGTTAADDAVDDVGFLEEKFGKIGTVLTGDAGNECFFHNNISPR